MMPCLPESNRDVLTLRKVWRRPNVRVDDVRRSIFCLVVTGCAHETPRFECGGVPPHIDDIVLDDGPVKATCDTAPAIASLAPDAGFAPVRVVFRDAMPNAYMLRAVCIRVDGGTLALARRDVERSVALTVGDHEVEIDALWSGMTGPLTVHEAHQFTVQQVQAVIATSNLGDSGARIDWQQ